MYKITAENGGKIRLSSMGNSSTMLASRATINAVNKLLEAKNRAIKDAKKKAALPSTLLCFTILCLPKCFPIIVANPSPNTAGSKHK